ncbi:MAG: bifunctional riboflavin kinase/FAD synthetase [Anaerolineae bacterium]|nr:bifunctional riboflavin kinase/FAD synthetase [Anaerolineae bacterium]
MQHIQSLENAHLDHPSIVTVGVFDGVHRGHQHLISHLVQAAHASNRLAVVLTFFPHPDVVIRGIQGPYYLTTPDERAALLGELGVDVVITHPFNDQTRQIRAADFVDLLTRHLKMASLWATPDFALGYKREGNVAYLIEQGHQKGFTVETIDLLFTDGNGERISSGRIRAALAEGDVQKVASDLGRYYRVSGIVVDGEKRGRQIGFPTANMAYWEQQVLPKNGIYASLAHLGSETFMAMTNVGVRPTFNGHNITVEPYLLDFDRDIYGQRLDLDFVAWLRGEAKFTSIDDLIARIRQDVEEGRVILEKIIEPRAR